MTPSPIAAITSYHAHVYFRDPDERGRASALRSAMAERFLLQLGRWHEAPIGPHAAPMYQVAFEVALFAVLIPWLMLNRQDLVILIHPNTGNARRDHVRNAFFMGEILPIIRPEQLPETMEGGEFEIVVPNTSPTLVPGPGGVD